MQTNPNTSSVHILLIEDNDADAYLIEETLTDVSRERFVISHVTSVEAAESHYTTGVFNVLLLDLSLPGVSGMEAVEKVRKDQPNTPIIVMTGSDDEEKAMAAMQRGVQDYLVKGRYSNEVLPRAIRYSIERKRFENKVIELAHFDQITGLINRELFNGRLEDAIHRASSGAMPLAVMLVSLRRFKDVTATLGYEAGDQLLKAVAVRLKENLQWQSAIARLKGDEFILLVTGADAAFSQLPECAHRIMEALSSGFEIAGQFIRVGCSIGVTTYPECGKNGSDLVKHADIALHRAKQSSKDEFQFFTQKLNEELLERIFIEKELRTALREQQMIPYYQPIIDLTNDRVCGVETLLRWQHPTKGMIAPSTFIPVAERSDLILDISEYVMQQACDNYRLWKHTIEQPFYVAINLSTKDFQRKDFTDRLNRILSHAGMNPKHVALEITEGTLMEDSAKTIEALKNCRSMGASIFVDDFGTGYSSLSYLSILPLDILKIDRSFVNDITTNPHNRLIATSTINLAQGLGLKIVAEGIETREQKELLTNLGCDKAQGYYFAKPMPVAELAHWLADYKSVA